MDVDGEIEHRLLISRLERIRFSETRIRPAYVKADIDQFISEVRQSLAGQRTPPLTAGDIRSAEFRTTRLKPGYDERQVDTLLDEVERALS